MPIVAQRDITAANQWTTPVHQLGWFNVSISNASGGSLGGTIVTAQRSWDYDPNTQIGTWRDVDTWTKSSEDVGFDVDLVWYTLGVKTGEYTAPVTVALSVMGSMRS